MSSPFGIPWVRPLSGAGHAGNPDWDWSGSGRVAYDRRTGTGIQGVSYFHVFSARLDPLSGVLSDERSLTYNQSGNYQQHNGNPAFDPTGRWIVYQSEVTTPGVTDTGHDQWAFEPGNGFFNALFIMASDGSSRGPLWVPNGTSTLGVLHPHFSPDGTTLCWSVLTAVKSATPGDAFGTWALYLADVTYPAGGLPTLSNVRAVTVPTSNTTVPQWVETYGFTADSGSVILASNPQVGQGQASMDICVLNLTTGILQDLMTGVGIYLSWDEHGRPSPDGTKIAYMSSFGIPFPPAGIQTEFWMMGITGDNKTPLTSLSRPGLRGYLTPDAGTFLGAARSAWSPDGLHLLGATAVCEGVTGRVIDNGPLVLISNILTPSRWPAARQTRARSAVARTAAARTVAV